MSSRRSVTTKLKDDMTDEEALNLLRQRTFAAPSQDHRHYVALATSTPRTAHEEVLDNSATDTDQGGVLLYSPTDEASTQAFTSSSDSYASLSSQPFSQLIPTMDEAEKKTWATEHNQVFLQSLNASMAAWNHANTPILPLTPSYIVDSSSSDSAGTNFSEQPPHENSPTESVPSSLSILVPTCALAYEPHTFRPCWKVLENQGVPVAEYSQRLGSGNYLGQRNSVSPHRVAANQENCALFLTKIPVEAELHEIFNIIKTGAVYCLHINPPNGIHKTKAAKLAFMMPHAAAEFLAEIHSPKGVVLHGQRIQGQYNRNAYARNDKAQSRVLKLVGPSQYMVLEFWTSHFSKFSAFELECYCLTPDYPTDGKTEIEFRFARIDGQAQTCLQCIRSDPTLAGIVEAKYAADPCGAWSAGPITALV
ncbi:hypothetical protein N431DRAFT_448239 [Stipitochalara longipes BDJ]|nr:hypothetical protein N431DRAFT_448239 [Stipitochalara longipes BDJ]